MYAASFKSQHTVGIHENEPKNVHMGAPKKGAYKPTGKIFAAHTGQSGATAAIAEPHLRNHHHSVGEREECNTAGRKTVVGRCRLRIHCDRTEECKFATGTIASGKRPFRTPRAPRRKKNDLGRPHNTVNKLPAKNLLVYAPFLNAPMCTFWNAFLRIPM